MLTACVKTYLGTLFREWSSCFIHAETGLGMVNYQTGQYTMVAVVDLEQGPHILSKKVEIIEGEKQEKGKQNKSPPPLSQGLDPSVYHYINLFIICH